MMNPAIPYAPIRAIHLDLKGMPPKMERLLQEIDLYAGSGYNALLAEWEDMFPWRDRQLRSPFAYTETEIRQFAQHAAELNLEIIPLVPSLGHLENVLKHRSYAHLRELSWMNSDMTPSAEGRQVIRRMFEEVLDLLPGTRYLHIGGDEVGSLGLGKTAGTYTGKLDLYLDHVSCLTDDLQTRQVRPLLWADMEEKASSQQLAFLKDRIDLAVWGGSQVSERIENFVRQGFRVWGAPCFKGADGITSDLPDLTARRQVIVRYLQAAKVYSLQGLIACGWSRYTTLRSQCEPVEGALDSAVMTGKLYAGDTDLQVEATLRKYGFEEDGKRSKELLQELTAHRRYSFKYLEQSLELSASLERLHAADDPKIAWYLLKMRQCIERFEEIKKAFHAHFDRFFTVQSVEDYLEERILPFRRIEKLLEEDDRKFGNPDAAAGYLKYFKDEFGNQK